MLPDPDFDELRPLTIDGIYYGEFALGRLCWWSHTLNSWNWPSDFPIDKPLHFDALEDHSLDKAKATKFTDPAFRDASDCVGNTMTMYEDLYHHNTFNLGHPISHFKNFWEDHN